ncbi:MAG: hypothetical protein HC906_04005 [Bacteroidales bacterium]|nr:hypothetical protein [Bacteroidales bacterium]
MRMESMGYTEFCFTSYLDSIEVFFEQTDSAQNKIELQGFVFENDLPGITYSAIGVNGAKIESFLKCQHFGAQLHALKPHLIILSFGTNDGYTSHFNSEKFIANYLSLISLIQNAAPEAAIIITVPNDSYYRRRYPNRNNETIKNAIFELAGERNFGVWDFYSVMGGFDSSELWYRSGLMNHDRIHFNKAGYKIKGDLFFAALIQLWEELNLNKKD